MEHRVDGHSAADLPLVEKFRHEIGRSLAANNCTMHDMRLTRHPNGAFSAVVHLSGPVGFVQVRRRNGTEFVRSDRHSMLARFDPLGRIRGRVEVHGLLHPVLEVDGQLIVRPDWAGADSEIVTIAEVVAPASFEDLINLGIQLIRWDLVKAHGSAGGWRIGGPLGFSSVTLKAVLRPRSDSSPEQLSPGTRPENSFVARRAPVREGKNWLDEEEMGMKEFPGTSRVFVRDRVLDLIMDHTSRVYRDRETEACGLLLGVALHQDEWTGIVVLDAVPSVSFEATLVSCKVHPTAFQVLERRRMRLKEDLGIEALCVGWYHSHPFGSRKDVFISLTDKDAIEKVFKSKFHLTMVVEPHTRSRGLWVWSPQGGYARLPEDSGFLVTDAELWGDPRD